MKNQAIERFASTRQTIKGLKELEEPFATLNPDDPKKGSTTV